MASEGTPLTPAPAALRRVLLVDQGLIPAVIDAAINGGIAWALVRGPVPLWPPATGEHADDPAVGPDLLITAVLLPVLTAVITERVIRWQVRSGDLPPLGGGLGRDRGAAAPARWPSFVRGLLVAAASLVAAAGPTIAVFAAADSAPLSPGMYVAFKAVWAAALGFAVTPVIAWWAWVRVSKDEVPR